jgi:hypothetical protein
MPRREAIICAGRRSKYWSCLKKIVFGEPKVCQQPLKNSEMRRVFTLRILQGLPDSRPDY